MDDKKKELLQKTERWIEAHRAEFVSELQALTRIPSVSRADLAAPQAPFGPECRRVLDHALERGRFYGFDTLDHDGYAGSICYGDPDNAIGLFTHLDVVPAGDGWLYEPFEALYLPEHDAVIGRGADDNKCAAVAMLFVLRMLREFRWPLKHGLRLYCGTSEETGMQDMLALKQRGMTFPKLSLVPDSGFPVNYGQKGSVSGDMTIACEGNLLAFDGGSARNVLPETASCVLALDEVTVKKALAALSEQDTQAITVTPCEQGVCLSAHGKSAHAASPGAGINALFLLSRVLVKAKLLTSSASEAIARLYELTSDYSGQNEGVAYQDEMSGALSLVYSVAHWQNGILSVKSDCRTPITCDVLSLVERLSRAWEKRGFTVVKTAYSKPYYRPQDDPYVLALQAMFHEVTGRDDKPFVMGGGNYARVIPNAISFGPGMPTKKKLSDFLPEGRGNCHGKDEAVIMEKVHNCAKLYVMAIATLDPLLP